MQPIDIGALYKLLGELQSDTKHILSEVQQGHEKHDKLEERITKLEIFKVRVTVYFAILVPVAYFLVDKGLPLIVAIL